MNMRHIFRAVAVILAVALLVLAVGCNAPADKTPEDPHAGHNHDTEATDTNATDANVHNHEEPAIMRLNYEDEAGGTFALVIKDCKGEVILNKKGLTKKAISNQVTNGIVELTWVTSNNPGGYESLYINRLTCQVSDVIVGEQTTDGNRIVYSEIKDGKLNVIVRDLFNKGGYNKVTVIEDAYTKGEYTVLGTVKVKEQVNVSYLTDKDGGHRIMAFDLYEKGEKKPTEATKKTEKK